MNDKSAEPLNVSSTIFTALGEFFCTPYNVRFRTVQALDTRAFVEWSERAIGTHSDLLPSGTVEQRFVAFGKTR